MTKNLIIAVAVGLADLFGGAYFLLPTQPTLPTLYLCPPGENGNKIYFRPSYQQLPKIGRRSDLHLLPI